MIYIIIKVSHNSPYFLTMIEVIVTSKDFKIWMRVGHRYIGYFMAGIMLIYALSGMLLVFRDTDFLKSENAIHAQLAPHLDEKQLAKELKQRNIDIQKRDGDVLFVHASARAPRAWEYITGPVEAERSIRATEARVTIVGHVHSPNLWRLNTAGVATGHVPVTGVEIPLARSQSSRVAGSRSGLSLSRSSSRAAWPAAWGQAVSSCRSNWLSAPAQRSVDGMGRPLRRRRGRC